MFQGDPEDQGRDFEVQGQQWIPRVRVFVIDRREARDDHVDCGEGYSRTFSQRRIHWIIHYVRDAGEMGGGYMLRCNIK